MLFDMRTIRRTDFLTHRTMDGWIVREQHDTKDSGLKIVQWSCLMPDHHKINLIA